MANESLENMSGSEPLVRTANEQAYLESMMPEVRQEGYTCVSGCSNCISCGGRDYSLETE